MSERETLVMHPKTVVLLGQAVTGYDKLCSDIKWELGIEMRVFENGQHIATIDSEDVFLVKEYFE